MIIPEWRLVNDADESLKNVSHSANLRSEPYTICCRLFFALKLIPLDGSIFQISNSQVRKALKQKKKGQYNL